VAAEEASWRHVIEGFMSGAFSFGPRTKLGRLFDKAIDKANQMRTPWFAHEYIMDEPLLRKAILRIAEDDMRAAYYPEYGDIVLRLNEPRKD
jgi:hypothetical protein